MIFFTRITCSIVLAIFIIWNFEYFYFADYRYSKNKEKVFLALNDGSSIERYYDRVLDLDGVDMGEAIEALSRLYRKDEKMRKFIDDIVYENKPGKRLRVALKVIDGRRLEGTGERRDKPDQRGTMGPGHHK